MFKLFVVVLVNIPLLSYLFESFLHGKDDQENLTLSFGVLLIAIYLIQLLMIMSLMWRRINIKQSYLLFILLFILAFVGLFNSNSVFYTCIVFLKYMALILFSIWLSYESLHKMKLIIIYGYYGSFLGFALFSVLHFYISDGDFLFTLAQIQLPTFFVLFLFAYTIYNYDSKKNSYFYLTAFVYLAILLLGGFRALDLEQFRFQYLPIVLFLIIAFLLLPKNTLIIALVILIGNLMYNTVEFVDILLYRIGSFEERMVILYVMAVESFYFLVPQGLGASDKLFNISSLTVYALSERGLYTPHSGFASMLFDSSVFFFIFIIIFYINLFKRMKVDAHMIESANYLSKSRIPFLTIFIFLYFFENIFYLKYTIAGATFSDDSLYIFIAMIFFYLKNKLSNIYSLTPH